MTPDDATLSTNAPTSPAPAATALLGQLRELLAADEAATVIVGIDGTPIDANAGALALFDTLGRRDQTMIDARTAVRDVLDQVPQQLLVDPEGGAWHGEVDLARPGDPPCVQQCTVLVRHEVSSPTGGYIALICRDVTDERTRVHHLLTLLEHDSTTGLLNRAAALDRTAAAVRASTGDHDEVAVLLIDVDRLRDVNDALGHDVGDRLLASTARRLATAVRPDDVVARVGGDEFLVICRTVRDGAMALELADRIRRSLTGRLTIRQLELDVSVSVGIAISDPAMLRLPPEEAAIQLVSFADTAVHAAKQSGRGKVAMFTPDLRSQARERTEMAAALSRALRGGELVVEYQPIFSAVSERAEAAEALLRWNHPTLGRLDAGDFITVAEQTGVIVGLGDWVLEQACTVARRWIDDGTVSPRFAIHVNVSRLQLSDPTFVTRVVDLLREFRLRPRQIVLEAREATLLGDGGEVVRSVRALRRVGVRVALDNFGTGADSLSILTDVGADVLKLDGGLALPSGSSDADTRVVRALVLLAHALNMEVVAERVTGIEQLRRLRAAGCDLVQGHLVGKPTPPEAFVVQMSV